MIHKDNVVKILYTGPLVRSCTNVVRAALLWCEPLLWRMCGMDSTKCGKMTTHGVNGSGNVGPNHNHSNADNDNHSHSGNDNGNENDSHSGGRGVWTVILRGEDSNLVQKSRI